MVRYLTLIVWLVFVVSQVEAQSERYQFVKGKYDLGNVRADEHSTLSLGRIDDEYALLRNVDDVSHSAAKFYFLENSSQAHFQFDFRVMDELEGVDTVFNFIIKSGTISWIKSDTSIIIYEDGLEDGDIISIGFEDHTITFKKGENVLRQFYTIAYSIKLESRITPLSVTGLYGEFRLSEQFIHPMMEVSFAQREVWIKEGEPISVALALSVGNTSDEDVTVHVGLISIDTPHFESMQSNSVTIANDGSTQNDFELMATEGTGTLGDNPHYVFEITTVEGTSVRVGDGNQLIVHVIESYDESSDFQEVEKELEPGDIVFIAFDNDIGGDADKIVLTNLVEIAPGTKFQIAKGKYNSSTRRWTSPDGGQIADIVELTYTGSQALPFNSIICFDVGSDGSTISDIRIDNEPAGERLSANAYSGSDINLRTSDENTLFIIQGDWLDQTDYSKLRGSVIAGMALGGSWTDYDPDGVSDLPEDIYCYHIQAQHDIGSWWGFFQTNAKTGCGVLPEDENKGSVYGRVGSFAFWQKNSSPTDDDDTYNIGADVCSPECFSCCQPDQYDITVGCGLLKVLNYNQGNSCEKYFDVKWQYRILGTSSWQYIEGANQKNMRLADYEEYGDFNSSSLYEFRPEIIEENCLSKYLTKVQSRFEFSITKDPTNPCLLVSHLQTNGIICQGTAIYTWWHRGPRNIWEQIQETNSNHEAKREGDYYVVVEFGDGLVYTSEEITVGAYCTVCSIDVAILDNESIEISSFAICSGDDYTIFTSAIGAIEDVYNYSWNTGAVTQDITVDKAGTYEVTVSDEYGCMDIASIDIIINDLPLSAAALLSGMDSESIITCDNPVISLTTPECDGCSYLWVDQYDNEVGVTRTIDVTEASIYTVIVTDSNSCFAESSITILEDKELPEVPESGGDIIICYGDSIPDLYVTGQEGVEFTWSLNRIGITEVINRGSTFIPDQDMAAGEYEYRVSAVLLSTGCNSYSSTVIKLTIKPAPDAPTGSQDQNICFNDSAVVISVNEPSEGFHINWYNAPFEGTLLQSLGHHYLPAVTRAGVYWYYAEMVDTDTGCRSLSRTPVSYEIHQLPGVPGDIFYEICQGDSNPALTPSVLQGYSVNWYTEAGEFLAQNTTYVPPDIEVGNYKYKTKTVNPATNCESALSSTAVFNIHPNSDPVVDVSEHGVITCDVFPSLSVSNPCQGCLYSWILPDGSEVKDSLLVDITTPGVYRLNSQVTYNDSVICTSEEQLFTIKEKIVPLVSGGYDHAICYRWGAPNTVFEIDEIPYGYSLVWTHDTGPSLVQDESDPRKLVYSSGALTEGTVYNYSFRLQDSVTNCLSLEEHTLSLEVLPSPEKPILVNQIADLRYCNGEYPPLLQVVEVSGVGYKWYNDSLSTDVLGEGITYQPTVVGRYYVEATYEATNCTSDRLEVQLFEKKCLDAYIEALYQSVDKCPGESIELSVILSNQEGDISYLWSTGESTPTIAVFPDDNMNYSVIVTDANIYVSATAELIVESCLMAYVDPSIPSAICKGDIVVLTARGEGGIPGDNGYNYLWSNGSEEPYIEVSPLNSTDYQVTITDSRKSASAVHTINVLPSITASISSDVSAAVCPGDKVTLMATVDNSNGDVTYMWNAIGTSSTVGSSSLDVYPNIPTSYILIVTDLCGDPDTSTIVVPVKSCMEGEIVADRELPICSNDSIRLSITPEGGVIYEDGYAYSWNTSGMENFIVVSPMTSTTYHVTVTDGLGTEMLRSYDVDVLADLTVSEISLSPSAPICSESQVTLTAPTSNINGTAQYVWKNLTTNQDIAGNTNAITQSPNDTTEYQVTVTDDCNDPKIQSISIEVKSCPIISSLENNVELCFGQESEIGAVVTGTLGEVTYEWTDEADNIVDQDATLNVRPEKISSIYTLTVSNGGEIVYKNVTVKLKNCLVGNNLMFEPCWGPNATLNAHVTGGKLPYSYSWPDNTTGSSITVPTNSINNTILNNDYKVTVTDALGFTKEIPYAVRPKECLTVTVNDLNVCAGSTQSLSASAYGGTPPYNYSWQQMQSDGSQGVLVTDALGRMGKASGTLRIYEISGSGSLSENVSNCYEYDGTGVSGTISGTYASLNYNSYFSNVSIEYVWESKIPKGTFSKIEGTGASLSISGLTETTIFRRGARPSICSGNYTYTSDITVDVYKNVRDGGEISLASQVCNSDYTRVNFEIESVGTIGGIGTKEYKWTRNSFPTNFNESEIGGNIAPGTSATFIRQVKVAECTNWKSSNSVTVGPVECAPSCEPSVSLSFRPSASSDCSIGFTGFLMKIGETITLESCLCPFDLNKLKFTWSTSISIQGESSTTTHDYSNSLIVAHGNTDDEYRGKTIDVTISITSVQYDADTCDYMLTFTPTSETFTIDVPSECERTFHTLQSSFKNTNSNNVGYIYLNPGLLSNSDLVEIQLIENKKVTWSAGKEEIIRFISNKEFIIPIDNNFEERKYVRLISQNGNFVELDI